MYGIDNSGNKLLGYTTYNGFGKGSDVYLFKAAFMSKEQLYLTMGHEYIHANLFAGGFTYSGSINQKTHHATIYQWETNQANAWGYKNQFTKFAANYAREYRAFGDARFTKFLIPIIKNRPR